MGHSLSPQMHNPNFEDCGINAIYIPLKTDPNKIATAVDALRAFHFLGANVTIPFKSDVIAHLDEVSEISQIIGAVNTIVNKEGKLWGTTTDPEGFLTSFKTMDENFDNKSVALFGTGGTARTLAYALSLMESPKQINILGRNNAKAANLAAEVKEKTGKNIKGHSISDFSKITHETNVIINATSVGMVPNTENSVAKFEDLNEGQVVYDVVYQPEETALLKSARQKGLKCLGGLGMLVYQGISSFTHWTGITPKPELYFKALRQALDNKEEHK